MNQILVTKKLYITPELKRKKKIYNIDFFLSIFLLIVLISVYIYAEYDRNKSEEVSQEILEEMQVGNTTEIAEKTEEDTTVAKDDKVLVIVLDDEEEEEEEEEEVVTENQEPENNIPSNDSQVQSVVRSSVAGYNYISKATISIPQIGVNYPILEGETGSAEETDALLKVAPCKFWGPEINEIGNYCIVGHNYRNSKFFSKVPTLSVGDTFTISEASGRTVIYKIYDKYTVEPKNVSCTSQLTKGKKEVTLITCTDNSEYRVIIKAREEK